MRMHAEVFYVLSALAQHGVPLVVAQLCSSVMSAPGFPYEANVECIDYFAGESQISRAFAKAGMCAISYEVKHDPDLEDIMKPGGLGHALQLALMSRLSGCNVFGIPCSTFCMLNYATHRRSKYRGLGNSAHESVRLANRLVSRAALLLMVLSALQIFWIIEQPLNSKLTTHPRMQQLISMFDVYETTTAMWKFSKDAMKPTVLYSNKKWITEIEEFRTVHKRPWTLKKLVSTKWQGKRKLFSGNRHLKSSQAYTPEFGEAVRKLYLKHKEEQVTTVRQQRAMLQSQLTPQKRAILQDIMRTTLTGKDQGWIDADLQPVFAFLANCNSR